MGRLLEWKIITSDIEKHDVTKELCIQSLEYEPEEHEKQEIYKKLNIDNKLLYQYNEEYNNIWCGRCKMFLSGSFTSNSIIDSINIEHSYSNSIWDSEWNIKNFYLGSTKTNFIRCISSHHLFREITKDDIDFCYKKINYLGEPIRENDKNAKNETIKILLFLEKYINQAVYIIFIDEY